MGTIVVGVDGSDDSHRALAWAVDEGRRRGSKVLVVHSWTFPSVPRGKDGLQHADFLGSAQKVMDEAIASIPDAAEVQIEREIANELPAQALVRCSEGAEMVVVASRGLGGFKGLLLGSVAQQVAHHAKCPVVIVKHT